MNTWFYFTTLFHSFDCFINLYPIDVLETCSIHHVQSMCYMLCATSTDTIQSKMNFHLLPTIIIHWYHCSLLSSFVSSAIHLFYHSLLSLLTSPAWFIASMIHHSSYIIIGIHHYWHSSLLAFITIIICHSLLPPSFVIHYHHCYSSVLSSFIWQYHYSSLSLFTGIIHFSPYTSFNVLHLSLPLFWMFMTYIIIVITICHHYCNTVLISQLWTFHEQMWWEQ